MTVDLAQEVLGELARNARELVARGITLAPPRGGRAWLQVVDERDVNAWLIVWSAGASTGLHDHGRAEGLVRVFRGALVERFTTPHDSRERVHRMYAGTTTRFGPGHRHDVQNAHRDEAMSLHVYAPRLEQMEFYPPQPNEPFFTPARSAVPVRA